MGFSSLQPAPGENFYTSSKDVNLTDVTTVIVTAGYSRINLYSDDTTSINRQILLEPSDLEGQQITLVLMSGDSTTCLLSTLSTSYVRLTSAWTPVQYGQITLQWTDGLWIDIGRTPVEFNGFDPVITNPQTGDILEYNGSEWVNVPFPTSSFTWVPCTTQTNWSGTIEVASVSANMKVLRGQVTSTTGTNSPMALVPSGYDISGSLLMVGSFNSGSPGFSPSVFKINGASLELNSLSSTIFTGNIANFDNIFYTIQ